MSLGFWETLASVEGDGTAITNTVTRTSLLTGVGASMGKFTLPANKLREQDQFHLFAQGRVSTVVTAPGNVTIDLAIGAVLLFSTLAMPLNVVAKTNVNWVLDVHGTVRTIGDGTLATVFWGGWWLSEASILVPLPATGPGPGGQLVPYNTPPVAGSGFNSTISNLLDLNWTFSVANAANSVTLHQYSLAYKSSTGF